MDVYLGTQQNNQQVNISAKNFARHMVCLGSSGSGKTVACKVVCEEFIRLGIPIIAIDPQGDIASLCQCENPKVSVKKGLTRKMIQQYQLNAEVIIWTPASSIGVPLSLNPLGGIKEAQGTYEETLRAISLAADSITALLDYELSSDDGRLVTGILNIALTFIHENALEVEDFTGLANFLAETPKEFFTRVQAIASHKDLINLSKKLRLLTVGVKKLLFELGKPLNIEELLGLGASGTPGKTRLSVIYLNTLSSQEEKEFFVARIASSLYQWMIANPSEEVQALFYIDEVAPFIPPVKKPACKDILKLLYKQARKYGIGCLIASQNPADIDYTAISQCSTWNLGRLLTRQDIKKVEKMLKSFSPTHSDLIVQKLPLLQPGQFQLFAPDEFEEIVELQVRWLITQHRTLDEEQIKALTDDKLRQKYLTERAKNLPKASYVSPYERTEEESKVEEQLTNDEKILFLLEKERACFSAAEIAEYVGINTATARKYLNKLGSRVKREKCGKAFLYWHARYKFLPQYNLISCIDVAKLQVLEQEAIRLAEKQLNRSLIFFETESISNTNLFYLPLWQVHFTEALEKSFLFFKSVTHKQENIYFHATNATICVYDRGTGFFFEETPKERPSILMDLDDVCTFERIVPGDLEIDWKFYKNIIAKTELEKLIARKFKIEVHNIAITFLPVWEFILQDKRELKKRSVLLDGVTGMPVEGV